jgi:hypothetical protein
MKRLRKKPICATPQLPSPRLPKPSIPDWFCTSRCTESEQQSSNNDGPAPLGAELLSPPRQGWEIWRIAYEPRSRGPRRALRAAGWGRGGIVFRFSRAGSCKECRPYRGSRLLYSPLPTSPEVGSVIPRLAALHPRTCKTDPFRGPRRWTIVVPANELFQQPLNPCSLKLCVHRQSSSFELAPTQG